MKINKPKTKKGKKIKAVKRVIDKTHIIDSSKLNKGVTFCGRKAGNWRVAMESNIVHHYIDGNIYTFCGTCKINFCKSKIKAT